MGLDLLVVTPIIITLLLGFRDGTVRKLVAVIMAVISMNLAKIYMGDVGKVLMERFQIESADAPTLGNARTPAAARRKAKHESEWRTLVIRR